MAIQKTNLLIINSIKNLAQFAVGFGLAVAVFGFIFDLQRVFLAAISLLLVYLASYLYNDIADLEEDKKDPFKLKFKPIAREELGVDTAKQLMGLFFILGFAAAFLIGPEFFATVTLMTVLNFVYSSPYIKYRNDDTTFAVSIFLLEFFKITAGWLAVIATFDKMPMLFVAAISAVYIAFGRVYKKKLHANEIFKDKVILGTTILGLVLYVISLLTYGLKVQMLLAPPIFLLILLPWKMYRGEKLIFERTVYMMFAGIAVLFLVSLVFMATPLGLYTSLNESLSFLSVNLFG